MAFHGKANFTDRGNQEGNEWFKNSFLCSVQVATGFDIFGAPENRMVCSILMRMYSLKPRQNKVNTNVRKKEKSIQNYNIFALHS